MPDPDSKTSDADLEELETEINETSNVSGIKILILLVKLLIAAFCLYYIFNELNLSQSLDILKSFDIKHLLIIQSAAIMIFFLPAVRLYFLINKKSSYLSVLNTVVLGIGLNNILPAKIGEVARIAYLKKRSSACLAEILSAVFWERFWDINILLILGIVAAVSEKRKEIFLPLLAASAAGWLFILLSRIKPDFIKIILNKISFKGIGAKLSYLLDRIHGHLTFSSALKVVPATVLIWIGYVAMYYIVFNIASDLNLSMYIVITIFAISVFAESLPVTPGGLGVVEAAIVAVLGRYGVEKESALAMAVVLRLTHFIPSVLWSAVLLLNTKFRKSS
ncbi:MAG: lysylphosphatidylglycerol synthase transmembrane domain-containing protein [Planctomycetota bacterium]|jgi:uncharacterized protein (TIRG00374 family)